MKIGLFYNFQNQYVYKEIDDPRIVGIDGQFNTVWNNAGEQCMSMAVRDFIG